MLGVHVYVGVGRVSECMCEIRLGRVTLPQWITIMFVAMAPSQSSMLLTWFLLMLPLLALTPES